MMAGDAIPFCAACSFGTIAPLDLPITITESIPRR